MNKLMKYNHALVALLLTSALVFGLGTVVVIGAKLLFSKTGRMGVQVPGNENGKAGEATGEAHRTISEPHFLSKSNASFLVAEVEIRKSESGSGFYFSKGNSWSGGTILNFYDVKNLFVGCNSCWFRNLIFFNGPEDSGQRLFESGVLITRVYVPNPESKKNPDMVLYSVIREDTNGDGMLNSRDSEVTYLTDVTFQNRTQVTPDETQLMDWKVDPAQRGLYLYVRKDTNKNGEYDELDERSVLYTNLKDPSMGRPVEIKSQ